MRFALYYTPPPSSLLWRLGSSWIGRDAYSGLDLSQPCCPGIAQNTLLQLTTQARRYGLHATLKPPFTLQRDATLSSLQEDLRAFGATQSPFTLGPLRLRKLMDFFCLGPESPPPQLETLASNCVKHFDCYRAPLSSQELVQRRRLPLNRAEETNLLRWGYPYVHDLFRFHITLSASILDAATAGIIQAQLESHLAHGLQAPLTIDAISLCVESHPGAPFTYLERYPLGTDLDIDSLHAPGQQGLATLHS